MSQLFTSFQLRDLKFKNRIFVSPMCQYTAQNGVPNDWHLVHLGSRAVGGAGLVMCEATSVSAEGRISPGDTGLWNTEQENSFLKITTFIKEQGSVPAIQIAHAGRKASNPIPWGSESTRNELPWPVVGPSPISFSNKYQVPIQISEEKINLICQEFVNSTERSLRAGFEVVEIHMAHGYLFHEFLSPLSNQRTDSYGGSLENRMRFPLRVAKAVREKWPKNLPVFVRISATDWIEPDGWTLNDSLVLAKNLQEIGIDLIDCSSGGNLNEAKIPVGPGYQVSFAEAIKQKIKIPTAAVGLITEPHQAEKIITSNQADAVFLARELLRNPYWPLHAAKALNAEIAWPKQYERAKV